MFGLIGILSIDSCKKENTEKKATPTPNNNPTDSLAGKDTVIEISTTFGTMYMWLYKQTPLHRNNFCKLTDSGFFNYTTFHRIVPNFVIQGGDPNSKDGDSTNDGSGGPGYTIPAEFRDSLRHVRGAVGAARLPDSVNPLKASSGSQFYICMTTAQTAQLNGNYTVFGFIMKGMDVADMIAKQPRNTTTNRPFTDISMQVKIIYKTLDQIKTEYNFTPPVF